MTSLALIVGSSLCHSSPPMGVVADTQQITLDLALDLEKRRVCGTAELRFLRLSEASELALDAAALRLEKVKLLAPLGVTGQVQNLPFRYDGNAADGALKIELPANIPLGEEFSIAVQYCSSHQDLADPSSLGGSVGHGLRFFAPNPVEPRRRTQVFSAGDSGGNRYWFPAIDNASDARRFVLKLNVPAHLMVISGGEKISETSLQNGRKQFHFAQNSEHLNARSGFVVGEFHRFVTRYKDVEIETFALPDEVQATKDSIVLLPEMFRYFEQLTGVPFPYAQYRQVVVQDLPWGIAYAGFSAFAEGWVDDARTHHDFQYLWDILTTYGLASQWFGTHVRPRSDEDSWLGQGLPNYLAQLFMSDRHGIDEITMYPMSWDIGAYFRDIARNAIYPVEHAHQSQAKRLDAANARNARASLALRSLHAQLGDFAFRRAIRIFAQQHAARGASTEDFFDCVEEASGQNYQWARKQWWQETGHPKFSIQSEFSPDTRKIKLKITQEQALSTHTPFAKTAFYQGWIEIDIEGSLQRFWLLPKANTEIEFAAANHPRWLNFDQRSAWLKDFDHSFSEHEQLALFRHGSDANARLASLNSLIQKFRAAQDSGSPSAPAPEARVSIDEIEEAIVEVAQSRAHWRLRWQSLLQWRQLRSSSDGAAVRFSETHVAFLKSVIQAPANLSTSENLRQIAGANRPNENWVRQGALSVLALSRDPIHAELYVGLLKDPSDRVINAAATALGMSKASEAFAALSELPAHPSWKNQSLISALNGLRELGDPRAIPIALKALQDLGSPRWTLATPVWDYQLAAVETLRVLGAQAQSRNAIERRLRIALSSGERIDVFNALLLWVSLQDAEVRPWFTRLRRRYAGDNKALDALAALELRLQV